MKAITSPFISIKAKVVPLAFAFAVMLAVALVGASGMAHADSAQASIRNSDCTIIGTYELGDDIDIQYIQLDSPVDTVVFEDVSPQSMVPDGAIVGLMSNTYYLEGTNEAVIRVDAKVTLEELMDNDSATFDAAALEGLDFSNAYAFFVMTAMDQNYDMSWYVYIVQVPEKATPSVSEGGFVSSAGVVGALQLDAYVYTDWSDWSKPVQKTTDLYTLTVPYGTASVQLAFDEPLLAYGYGADGEYLSSGSVHEAGYADDGRTGEYAAVFTADSEGMFVPFIEVQTPYDENWGNEICYAIKIEYSDTFTATVEGAPMVARTFIPDAYTYFDYVLGQSVQVGVFVVPVPAGTQTVDLAFSDNVLAYNYTKNGDYLYGSYSGDALYVGTDTATVSVDYGDEFTPADGEADYIQVQSPYDASWNSTLHYAITFDVRADNENEGEMNPVTPAEPSGDAMAIMEKAGARIDEALEGDGSVYGREWWVMEAARANRLRASAAKAYASSVLAKLEETGGTLHASIGDYTNYAKTILALTAAGYDARRLDAYDLTAALANYDAVVNQGLNGATYALLALDSHDYEIPQAAEGVTQTTRDKLVDYILGKELKDGGWAYSGATSDPDMTSIAIQALAPYRTSNPDVAAAVERGVSILSEMQQESGGYVSWGVQNSNSAAQVIVALTAVGIDPTTDGRFVKNGKTVVDALCSFASFGGGFGYNNTDFNEAATQQGFYALEALKRFSEKRNSLYDMTDTSLNAIYEASAVLVDPEGTGITVEGKITVPSGDRPVLVVGSVDEASPEYGQVTSGFSKDETLLGVYSINLMQNGEAIHEGFGSVDVSFPVGDESSGRTVDLFHLHADGTLTIHSEMATEGIAAFRFEDFSVVGLGCSAMSDLVNQEVGGQNVVAKAGITTTKAPNTGDSAIPLSVAIVVVLIAAGSLAVVSRKIRRR